MILMAAAACWDQAWRPALLPQGLHAHWHAGLRCCWEADSKAQHWHLSSPIQQLYLAKVIAATLEQAAGPAGHAEHAGAAGQADPAESEDLMWTGAAREGGWEWCGLLCGAEMGLQKQSLDCH